VDVYEGQGLPDRAVREIDRALEAVKAGRERSSLYLRRGLVLQKAGRKADAAESFLAAAGANPASWEAQYNLGASLLGSKPADALARFQLAAKLRPDDGETQLGIATAQDALKNHPAAYATAKGATGLLTSPALQARARYLAGRNAYLAGRPAEAAGELKPLVAADPNNFDYQLWHGLSLYAIKDYAGAAASLEAALKARPASSLARTNLGAAYVAAKRYPDAEQVLRAGRHGRAEERRRPHQPRPRPRQPQPHGRGQGPPAPRLHPRLGHREAGARGPRLAVAHGDELVAPQLGGPPHGGAHRRGRPRLPRHRHPGLAPRAVPLGAGAGPATAPAPRASTPAPSPAVQPAGEGAATAELPVVAAPAPRTATAAAPRATRTAPPVTRAHPQTDRQAATRPAAGRPPTAADYRISLGAYADPARAARLVDRVTAGGDRAHVVAGRGGLSTVLVGPLRGRGGGGGGPRAPEGRLR
jgi:tetratricopeptide (TPR) repeat protein